MPFRVAGMNPVLLSKSLARSLNPVRSGAREPSSGGARFLSRRRILLGATLVVLAGVYVVSIGLPRWRAYRYARMSPDQLAPICASGDVAACDALSRTAIALKRPEKAIEPLVDCWRGVVTGRLSLPPAQRARIAGNLGLMLMLALRIDEAPPYFQEALRQDMKCVPAHVALALWLQSKRFEDGAMDELRAATQLDPRNDMAWFLMAHLFNENNMLDQAREMAQKAIAINPKVASYWQELGDSYGYANRHAESLPAYQEELKLDSDLPVARADVARALALSARTPAQYREAVQRVEDALKTNIVYPAGGYTLLGELHLKFGHYPEARKALEASLKYDPTVPQVYYSLSRACRLAGDKRGETKAMRQYQEMERHYRETQRVQKKVSEMPKDPDLRLALARAWLYYKAWPDARREYQEALRLRPGDAEATGKLKELNQMAARGQDRVPYNWVLELLRKAGKRQPSPGAAAGSPAAPK